MVPRTILVATWSDGLFVFADGARRHELSGRSVRGLAADGQGGALAIVDGHTLRRRAADGTWTTIAAGEWSLSCAVIARDTLYVGTDDARVLRVGPRGELEPLPTSTPSRGATPGTPAPPSSTDGSSARPSACAP